MFSETMESGAVEIWNKALNKKWKDSDTHTMPPPASMVVLYIVYSPLQMVR